MIQKDKELLLKDLSARLPYGVRVDYKEDKYDFHHWKISTLHAPAYSQSGSLINTSSDGWIEYEEYKGCGMSTGSRPLHLEITLPFLCSMSSMTEKEKEEIKPLFSKFTDEFGKRVLVVRQNKMALYQDWLNAHYFDYRGLIEKRLALEAKEGIYEKK